MKHTLIASAIATGLALASLAPAARAEEPELRQVRLCDVSACYYAWNVVDRDGDGVSDADEVVAGTDPLDPASRPPLPLIVDMIGAQLLPTFEFGVGKVVVRPAELHAAFEKYGGSLPESPLAAFPLGERKDAMTRLGLDVEQMAGFGLSVESDGFSLERGFDKENRPVRRVGGVDLSLISADADDGGDVPDEGPKVVYSEPFENGDLFIKLEDGDEVLIHKDGSSERTGPDGMPKKNAGYVNPDADTGDGKPTEEQIKAWARVRNATVRTVFGWSPIQVDPKDIEDRKGTIILIDPNYMDYEGIVSGPPQIDRAQPEARPDLPNPMDHVDPCWPKCN
jgi:hypothetical protein